MQIEEFELDSETTLYDDNMSTQEASQEREVEDEDTHIRRLIYERLGLAFGSLANEGGNDWIRARDEVLAELKEQQLAQINTANLDAPSEISDDRAEILSDFKPENEEKILELIASENLNPQQIDALINLGKKDILIALARSQNLAPEQIAAMLPAAPYLAVKMIINHQNYSGVRDKLVAKVKAQPMIYKELLEDIKASKW